MKRMMIAACAIAAALCGPASAQDYPTKTVTMVIPFPAGAGANDVLGRFMADRLSKLWGKPVVVENRPGANSTIGALDVIRSRPDGYTMLFSSANYTMTPAVVAIPFDAAADLRPVGLVGTGEYLLITGPHTKAKNVPEFVAQAGTRQMVYAGGTPGADLAAELFMKGAGIKMKRVPYKGTNDSYIDLLGGRIDFVVAAVGAQVGSIAEGKVVGLAVTGPNRSPLLPNVPSLREQGFAEAELPTWWGLFVPAKTPDDIVDKINAGINAVLQQEDTKQFFARQSVVPTSMSPQEMSTLVKSEIAKFKALVRETGLRAEN